MCHHDTDQTNVAYAWVDAPQFGTVECYMGATYVEVQQCSIVDSSLSKCCIAVNLATATDNIQSDC